VPLYEFECDEHGRFDTKAPMGTDSAPCPTCGDDSERVFSPPRHDSAVLIPEKFQHGARKEDIW
jgi:putative FmdB family regulatory protein